jgi:hypothetical protein
MGYLQEHEYVYCLAIVKSMKLNIIGRKFSVFKHYFIVISIPLFYGYSIMFVE